MKLLVKPLKGGEFTLDNVELSQTVLQVKEMIQKERGADSFPVEAQKLIHSGRIMKDDQTLESYKLKAEGAFIVCMVSKKKPKKKPVEKPAAAPAANQASANSNAGSTAAAGGNAAAAGGGAPQAQAAAGGGAAAALGAVNEASLAQLTGMGFEEGLSRRALVAAFGDVNRATEYAISGNIPDINAMQGGAPAGAAAAGAGGGGGGNPLENFRNHPQLNQIRRMVQDNPQSLDTVIRGIAQSDPELHAAIQADQDAFVDMLNEPIDGPVDVPGAGGMPGEGPTPEQLMQILQMMQQLPPEQQAQLAQSMGMNPDQLQQVTQLLQNMPQGGLQQLMGNMAGGGGGGGMGGPGADQQLGLSTDDTNAVNRLFEMTKDAGYTRAECLQAYIACDRDENAAANLIFQAPPEALAEDNNANANANANGNANAS